MTRQNADPAIDAGMLAVVLHISSTERPFEGGEAERGDVRALRRGDRIAQLVLLPVVRATLQVVDTFEGSARGEGGFGHTGVR